MKKGLLIIALLGLCILLAGKVLAQPLPPNTASQTVNLTVDGVARLAVSGTVINLTISDGVAGTTALTPVTNSTTTYRLTQNMNPEAKITANIDADLPANTSLTLALTPSPGKGVTPALPVDISSATTAVEMVTDIPLGADNGCTISYTFSANAEAGVIATSRTVTLTLVTL